MLYTFCDAINCTVYLTGRYQDFQTTYIQVTTHQEIFMVEQQFIRHDIKDYELLNNCTDKKSQINKDGG